MKRTGKTSLLLFFLMMACIDPFDPVDLASPNMLVVEGVLSSQLKKHQIYISRTTAINDRRVEHEQGATVTISDDEGEVISLTESSPGIYETPEFAAESGRSYTLHIVTADDSEYASRAELFVDGPEISDVYAKYIDNPNGEGKGVQVSLDTEDPTNQSHFYRWNYVETYQVIAPFGSNYVWTGGTNLEWRYDRIDTCYVTDTLRNILLMNTEHLEQTKISKLPIRYIDEFDNIFRRRYSILVQQYSLSAEAYRYWDNLRITSEQQGSLSDRQPGSLAGNMFSVSNPDEIVIGYFEAGQVSEKRIFFSAITFYNEGLKMPPPFRSYCYEIQPVIFRQSQLPSLMPLWEHNMNVWDVSGTGDVAVYLMPKTCTDCRDKGTTVRPDFF